MFRAAKNHPLLLMAGAVATLTIAACVLVNLHYFFQAEAYEFADHALNSLQVLKCKSLACYQGAYSRWGFHHPGPALFYWYALGEIIFWQTLHLTRTPINAQVLSGLILNAAFLGTGIGVAAHWVRSRAFVPLALLLAMLHFTAVNLRMCMLDTWPPYMAPLPYFCLLLSAASVAAGRGEDLPVVALTGCLLIHIHVASPLYVLPLFALAYAGLFLAHDVMAVASHASHSSSFTPPWRRFPRAHLAAGIISLLFLIPILVDLCHGTDSSMAAIVRHVRAHRGEHHAYIDSLYYLIRFANYWPSVHDYWPDTSDNVKVEDGTTWAMIANFLAHHGAATWWWLATCASPVLIWLMRLWSNRAPSGRQAAYKGRAVLPDPAVRSRQRYLAWLGVFLAIGIVLALYWGHIQDGEMLYYNGWYFYGLFGGIAIFAAGVLSDLLESIAAWFQRPAVFLNGVTGLGALLIPAVFFGRPNHPERFRASLGDDDTLRAQAHTVFAALASAPSASKTKFLVLPSWPAVLPGAGVAILLKRLGYDFRVDPRWRFWYGAENTLPDTRENVAFDAAESMQRWRVIDSTSAPIKPPLNPLADQKRLEIGETLIDLTDSPVIHFSGTGANFESFTILGWAEPNTQADAIWTVGNVGWLEFRGRNVPSDKQVEISFDFETPLIAEAAPYKFQILDVQFNDVKLGSYSAGASSPKSIKILVPAAVWNLRERSTFILRFPRAVAPAVIDPHSKDSRLLAFATKSIAFRVINAPGTQRAQ